MEYASRNKGTMPSIQQIRNKLNNNTLSLDDWAIGFGANLLKYVASLKLLQHDGPRESVTLSQDFRLLSRTEEETSKGK